ncbi:general secretion pathway protein GspB [Acidovorax sp. FJL06]|uniref:general secretion pathway protein GspB n=1 Tax=Acidovorax sp. FJL06 TaxID=2153365 RepID=UPI000F5758EF|nr:general secretion pathway protein GspB [Acidovorax sp. FJL06]RQO81971.1 hypothetical protein DBV10_11820 [Acidovorax sp. FJL06]
MSYILDALRRAEAERGRGAVPGLHTQAVPVPGAAAVAERPAAPAWRLATAGVAVAAVAVAGTWWVMQPQRPAPVVVAAAPAPGPVAPTAPIAPAAPAVALPAAQAIPAPALAPTPAPTPVPAVLAPPPEPRSVEKRSAAPPREKPAPQVHAPRGTGAEPPPPRPRADPARDPAPARAPEPAAVAAAPAPTTATGTVFAQADLPEAVRAQLPSLKISGVTYSGNPAYRMAIVNGQVLHEGDPAGPGLLLERIEPGRTIWSFKGYRYGLASQ